MANAEITQEEYQQFQQMFVNKQFEWKNQFSKLEINGRPNKDSKGPLIFQKDWHVSAEEFQRCLIDMCKLLKEIAPKLTDDINKLEKELNEKTVEKWFEQALAVNEGFFQKIAEKHQISNWIPHFIAENAIRPVLQLFAEIEQEKITKNNVLAGCPCCGEPPRLAEITKEGKKNLLCPRCSTTWNQKKIACAHCGNDDHNKIRVITIEDQSSEQIHICLACKNYTKVINTNKQLTKKAPAILDLDTIHLDYIAQSKLVDENEQLLN